MNMGIRVFVRVIVMATMVVASASAFGATVTWTAGGGGVSWNVPANWSTGFVPGSGDDVIMANVGGANVTVDVTTTVNSLIVQNGKHVQVGVGEVLTLNSASTVDSGGLLAFNTSDITVNGTLTVNGILDVFGGTLGGSGTLIINSGGSMTVLITANTPVVSIPTSNAGMISYMDTASPGPNFIFSGATLTNTGIIDIRTDHNIDPGLASPILNNGGVIKKSLGSGSAAINFIVNNAFGSTMQAQSGTLALNNGGAISGAYSVSSGRTLSLSGGTFTMSGSPTFSGLGTLSLGSGATLVLNAGTFTMSSGTFAISGNPTVSGAGTLAIAGTTLSAGAGVDVTWPNLTLSAGTITGAGAVRVSGSFAWSGGTISGSGARVLNSTSTATISCSTGNCLLDVAALQLQASTTFSASSNPFVFSNGASLTIDPGKTLSITNNGALTPGAFGGSVTNNGTIWKKTAAGTSTIGVPVTMLGTSTVDLDAGTLQFGGGATVVTGATIDIAGGTTLEVTGGVFLFTSGAVSMPGSGTFKVSGGTLRVPTSITTTIPNVTLQNSGVIDGAGTLILSGPSSWTGGTMGSAAAPGGITQIDPGNTLSIIGNTSPQLLTQNRQLLNNGTVSYGGIGANTLTMSAGSKITNNGVLNLINNSPINNSPAGSALIENNGILSRNFGGGSTLFPRVENNNGATVNSISGTIQFSGGGIAAGAYAISGGAFITLAAGTITFANTSTVTGAGILQIEDATVDISSGANALWPNIFFSGGTIGGAGTLHATGNFTWSGGTIAGAGPRVLDSSSTPVIDGGFGTCALDGAALQLQASATFSAPNSITFSNGASLTIDPGKTLSITNDGDFSSGAGGGSVINNGTIWKKTTSGTSTIAVPVTMPATSTIDLDAGTLQFGGGASVTAGATIDVAAGTTLEVTGGVFLFSSGPVTMPGSGTFKVSGGTLRVPTSITNTVPNVTLQGSGVLDGGGTLILSGTSTWSGGTMGSVTAPGGITQINGGSTLNITAAGSQTLTQARELQNGGTVNYGGTSTLTMSGASKITNSAAFNITADRSINVSGSATIDNNGTLTKTGGSGTSTLFPAVNNSGTLSATSGALSLAGGGTNSGSFTVTSPGNLSFSAGTHSMAGGGSINGTGTMTFSGATATVGIPVNVGALNVTAGSATLNANGSADAFTMSGGTLGGSGTLTLNNGGSWSGGTMSGSGTTTNPATKSFSIPGAVTLSRTLHNDGTLNVTGAVVTGSGTIDNNGVINDGGGATISVPMNNGGQIATSNVLALTGNGTHSGTFTANGPGSVIDFSGGTQTISGAFAGTGKFRFSGAAATVNGAWSGRAIDVAGGSVALNTSGTLPALTLSGGTLAGNGNLTVTGSSTWSGGTIGGSGALTFDAGAIVTMPGTSAATLTRPLLNQGTINFTAASSAMLIDGVTLTNSGTFDIQSSQGILVTAGTPPFVNNGTLKKSAGAGVMQFAAPVMNSGLVQASAGTLNFTGTYAQSTGTTDVQTGATLQTATLSLNGGSLIGNGTIAGTVDNHAVVAPGASPGTLTINGDYVQASNGVLNIQIGGTAPGTQYDQLLVSGNVTLGGTLNVSTINSFVPTAGNAFQILTFGAMPNSTTFAFTNGLNFGSGLSLVPTYSANDLQLITNNVQTDLTASVTAPLSVANGSAFTYTVTIFNQGGSNATAVTFNAALPANVTFNDASPAICGGAPNLVCTIGAVPNQSAAVVVLNVTANGAGSAPIIVSTVGNEFDPNTGNNAASASPSITGAADLRIAVTGTPSTVAGSRAFYTIAVTNNGPDVANGVTVSVAASPGLTFSANSGACTGGFPCTIGTLSSGQSATINSAWDISPAAAGSVQLTFNTASSTADPNSSNNSASAATLIGTCPAIVIEAPGGLPTGANAEATATLVGGMTYNWSISNGTIDSGDGTSRITFTAGAAGTTTLAVNVTGGGCTLSTNFQITVKPRPTCQGTAAPKAPADGATTDATVTFSWSAVEGASGYRLWLQQAGVPAQNLGRTLDTSLTEIIPPGTHQWYVETLFDGCASQESKHLALTILPATDCASHGAPQLSAPANDMTATNANVVFSWETVAKALEYELWLEAAGGVPTLIRATSDTSYTATVPPGPLEWYVRAVFGGCAATESAHRTFTYTPPPECTSQRPLLIQPAEGERLTSPVSFEWRQVSGATEYELYVDDVLASTTTAPQVSGIFVPLDERRWRVRARLAEGCGSVDSAESRFAVIAAPPSCAPLDPPELNAPSQISSGVAGRILWSFVGGATAYVVEISSDPQFPRESTSVSTVVTRQLPFTFTNEGSEPAARYVRVFAVDTNCVPPGKGPFSPITMVSVLPRSGRDGVALLTDPTDVPYTLSIAAQLAGLHFTATPTEPWITVTPASGTVPPGGLTLHAFAHTAGLPPGASTGSVVITTAEAAGKVGTRGDTTTSTQITLNSLTGSNAQANSTPPQNALIIPAVAKVTGFVASYDSDVRVTNTSAHDINYKIHFTPTGQQGMSQGQTTFVPIKGGATIALNNVISTWFGGTTTSGTLQITPQTETATSTSIAPASGLTDRNTFASSRTYAVTSAGGTFGQYVPAVPYTNFVGQKAVISLQQIAQSESYHTNIGLVEGSGKPVSVQVRIFGATGAQLGDFSQKLSGGQYIQVNNLNDVLKKALDDGRIEVEVTEGEGKVTAYASVIENKTNDPLLVPPVTLTKAGNTKWVVPGVADLTSGSGRWQTDVRIFNAGEDAVELTLLFHSKSGTEWSLTTEKLLPREVRQFNGVLSSFFGIKEDFGALHVSSAAPARLVVTARTYNETAQGTYGQFIPAVTPEEAVAAGSSSPLQILQVEESQKYSSNVGFAEVSGEAVTLRVSVFQPNDKPPKSFDVDLGPNGFLQIDSLLTTHGLDATFNARITVQAIAGKGRATAYLSLIDKKTGDPTYIPGQ
jgi:uncharacterized repeat protein (TIGR01451 family)